jgi:integrase
MFAMTTGARRGEICGLRWTQLDLDSGVAVFRASVGQIAGERWEKDTKTHHHRRVTLDDEMVAVLREHRARCEERARLLNTSVRRNGFVFSPAPDCTLMTNPDTLTQRYGRLAKRLGFHTHLHSLRHYSATELISAGVDIRTVAGRLGHSGGGSTTLRTYSAFTLEADQRAAAALAGRRPAAAPPPRRAT